MPLPQRVDPTVAPIVAGLRRSLRLVTVAALTATGGWVVVSLAAQGLAAVDPRPYLPFTTASFPRPVASLALPAALALPPLWIALRHARGQRSIASARWLLWSVFVVALVNALPRGVLSPSWYVHPVLVMLTAVVFGVVPGLTMALFAAGALTVCATFQAELGGGLTASSAFGHALPVVAVILAGGLVGAFLHKAVRGVVDQEFEQRRRVTQTLKALRHRERLLRHAMRVGTVGDMAGMIVHQLRNKFQLINGYVALGLRAGEAAEKDRRFDQVREALAGAGEVVEQLLRLAHPGEEQVRIVDLVSQVRDCVARVRRVLPAAIAIHGRWPEQRVPVQLDPDELEHALLNLVINARQAMRRGNILVEIRVSGGEALLLIADDGPGMSQEVRSRVFTPYFTTKAKGEGTGLGLAAVDRFVRASGGRVAVSSEEGNGATFTLTFPLATAPQPTSSGARAG